jgi:hypothetical protein
MLPAPTENPILVTSIGTLLATEYAVAPNDHNWILLILTVENLLQVSKPFPPCAILVH